MEPELKPFESMGRMRNMRKSRSGRWDRQAAGVQFQTDLRVHLESAKGHGKSWKAIGKTRLAGPVVSNHLAGGVMEDVFAKALGQDVAQLPAAEKRDLLARLLKRLAHEIRNPLSSLGVHFQLI